MKFKSHLLVVMDMEKSKVFYRNVLGLRVVMDFGANITLTGGVSLQTRDSWIDFIDEDESGIVFHGNDAELYFEEDDFDGFLEKLSSIGEIQYVHLVKEHSWGQRVVRFYDPDHHIIEVGENLMDVCRRFLKSGLTVEETAKRMGVPVTLVQRSVKG